MTFHAWKRWLIWAYPNPTSPWKYRFAAQTTAIRGGLWRAYALLCNSTVRLAPGLRTREGLSLEWIALARFVSPSVLFLMIALSGSCSPLWSQSTLSSAPVNRTREGADAGLQAGNLASWNDPLVSMQQEDASLNKIAAVGLDRLWAVGDRGVIIATADAGRKWRRQASKTSATLTDVVFADERWGWVVGGESLGYSRSSRGVVLETQDAGENWSIVSGPNLPHLQGIQLIQPGHLVAWGDWSPALRSSLFESRDGGRNWSPISTSMGHCRVGSMQTNGNAVFIDSRHQVLTRRAPAELWNDPRASQKGGLSTAVFASQSWWIAGDAGQIYQSPDAMRWQAVNLPLSREVASQFDFRTLASFENHVWVAGNPGTVVWHSADSGQTWESLPTESTLPIHQLIFVDPQRGWAIGPMATILATRDGGRTWWAQNQAGRQLGTYAITGRLKTIPWNALAASAIEDFRHTGYEVLHDQHAAQEVDYRVGISAAINLTSKAIGLAAADMNVRHPIAKDEYLSNADWSPYYQSSGSTPSALVIHLVRQIRSWRPEIIITDSLQDSGTIETATANAVLDAVQRAGVEGSIPAEIESAWRLPTWSVPKVVCRNRQSQHGFGYDAVQLLRQPGQLLRDVLQPVESHIRPILGKWESIQRFQTQRAPNNSDASYASLTGGLPANNSVRRPGRIESVGNFQVLLGASHRQEMLRRLLDAAGPRLGADPVWESQLDLFVRSIPRNERARALYEIANHCSRGGYWQRYSAALQRLVSDSPDAGSADWAWGQLLRFAGSQEIQHWIAMQASKEADALLADHRPVEIPDAPASSPFADAVPIQTASTAVSQAIAQQSSGNNLLQAFVADSVVTASAQIPLPLDSSRASLPSADLVNWIAMQQARTRPNLSLDPQFQLMQIAWRRRSMANPGMASDSVMALQELARQTSFPYWSQTAAQEILLADGQDLPARGALRVSRALVPPSLDGFFDDKTWQNSIPVRLAARTPTAAIDDSLVRIAHDEQWLYLSIACPNAEGTVPAGMVQERSYDADLSNEERIEISLDVDRDYASFYQFQISPDGRTFDSCCEFSAWNPQWFVDVNSSDANWTAEAAIRLADLVDHPVDGQAWGISIRRIVPGKTVQAWSRSTSAAFQPESFGVMVFE